MGVSSTLLPSTSSQSHIHPPYTLRSIALPNTYVSSTGAQEGVYFSASGWRRSITYAEGSVAVIAMHGFLLTTCLRALFLLPASKCVPGTTMYAQFFRRGNACAQHAILSSLRPHLQSNAPVKPQCRFGIFKAVRANMVIFGAL